ncbi:Laccase domain protein YfiH [Devosia equisanguinis]|uniref:Purine nucleoside phosphorylase n=1 Tax=Devosia equisanguinis TaxID=2490941 RepID=A0A3S4D6H2_9HYPH|nr:Laccase domain protein YfiH [Devosia equisanguinis]
MPHGFFGRDGGVSLGDFAGNNMSTAVGDDAKAVAANRAGALAALGFAPDVLCLLRQVHSARVETITGPIAPGTIEADAMVTDRPGLVLGILTADCTPILLADAEAGVVGAAHAGWRGAVDGIAAATVKAMVALGAEPSRITAAIGPTITQPNYEVGEQFRADVLALHPDADRYFVTPPGGKPHFDLPGLVEEQLRAAGIATVERVGGCTYGQPERYFSHRFATHRGTGTGRQIALVATR